MFLSLFSMISCPFFSVCMHSNGKSKEKYIAMVLSQNGANTDKQAYRHTYVNTIPYHTISITQRSPNTVHTQTHTKLTQRNTLTIYSQYITKQDIEFNELANMVFNNRCVMSSGNGALKTHSLEIQAISSFCCFISWKCNK